jgi:SHS family lactate transporter-like MFS transporter
MFILSELRGLSSPQRKAVLATYLGWTLDAFDFFILVFVVKDIAAEFVTDVEAVTYAITLTLVMRPLGALIFGLAADRFGRRPTLMVDVLLYSILEFASGFAPSLTALIVLRALYGIAMGGEWGVGASLAMESIPPKARGIVSGILQAGYPSGYLLASIVFGVLFSYIGWRGMFMIGALPALLVFYIRRHVEESPAFLAREPKKRGMNIGTALRQNWALFLYAVGLMTAFNFFSHGTQDLYPTFLRTQHGFDAHTVGTIAVVYNIGAILGGLSCGYLSERFGRRRVIAAAALCTLPVIPLWAFSTSPYLLAAGAFLMQFAVQGAWGVVPVHLNELSPDEVRGTFPGVVYQLGNLLASYNATMQADIAARRHGDYGMALALVAGVVAVVLALLASLGTEKRGVVFGRSAKAPAE